MNIYLPYPNVDSYDSIHPVNMREGHDYLDRFLNHGKYQNINEESEYIPVQSCIHSFETKRGNFLGAGGNTLACDIHTWNILQPIVEDRVKLFPLNCGDKEYIILKVTNIIDCLDYSKADVFRFQETGRVLHINKYAFKKELIRGEHLFAIPEKKFGILVSQEFKNYVEKHDLKGLLFQQVSS